MNRKPDFFILNNIKIAPTDENPPNLVTLLGAPYVGTVEYCQLN
jgi:hypothetical protein